MIQDLDSSIEKMLLAELEKEGFGDQVSVSFDIPDSEFPPSSVSLPAVNVFLYDIRENLERRTSDRLVSSQINNSIKGQLHRAPVWVTFSFLVTAWPSSGTQQPAQNEHMLLGAVMKGLLRHATLPADVLTGSLKDMDPRPSCLTLQPNLLQSPGEFWQAMGGKPRPSINFSVSMCVDVHELMDVTLVDPEKTQRKVTQI